MKKQGFTLIELIVAGIIASVLAVMALTSYQKTVVREKARRAQMDAYTIWGAQKVYKGKHGQYWLPPTGIFDLAVMNQALGTNITAVEGVEYQGHWRPDGGADGFVILAANPTSHFTFVVNISDEGPVSTAVFPLCAGECP